MSDREATAETKETYALARRGLPLRGLAQSAPRAHWLPPIARLQTMSAPLAQQLAQAEANVPESGEFDPFSVSEPMSAPSIERAPSALIRDAGAALSIIADEGFEIEPAVSMSSRTVFDAIDSAAPQRAREEAAAATGSESIRTAVSMSSDWPMPRSAQGEFAHVVSDMAATAVRHKSSTPLPAAFDAPSIAIDTARLVSEDAGRPAPRGAIASREREMPSMNQAVSSSLSRGESNNIVVSDTRRLDDASSIDTETVAAHAQSPSSTVVAQARKTSSSKTDANHERRDIADARRDAYEIANEGLRRETVEMGAPSVMPSMPRTAGDSQVRAFATPRPLDAAQIASLLSPPPPPSASSGPSVTIDRVQVTVQSTASSHPAAAAAPVTQQAAAQQRQAPSSGYRSPGYQNPWASYFARRD